MIVLDAAAGAPVEIGGGDVDVVVDFEFVRVGVFVAGTGVVDGVDDGVASFRLKSNAVNALSSLLRSRLGGDLADSVVDRRGKAVGGCMFCLRDEFLSPPTGCSFRC